MLSSLQRLSVAFASFLRRTSAQTSRWIQARPKIAAWVITPGAAADSEYRDFNHRYFAHFYEQEKMLADKPRMAFYHAAVSRHIQPGDRVIDLGTGTGILAAFAARRGAAKVYAIDHSAILEHAKTLAAHNRIENVEFVAIHSKDFKLAEKVDVILHEQMGDYLFDEAMVANVIDLRERLLKPSGLILPACFELYCEPMTLNPQRHVPFIWDLKVHGYDYACMEWSRPQDPNYYHLRGADLGFVQHFLSEPEPVFSFDLNTIAADSLPAEIAFTRTVTQPGRLDGFVVYFRARVEELSLSTSPLDPGRAPHWGYRILRTPPETFAVGDLIEAKLSAKNWADPETWRWTQVKGSAAPQAPETLQSV